jgi:type II secretory pathway component GspD/PulD (secretin)
VTKQVQTLALVLMLAAGGALRAQDKPAPPPPRPPAPSVPVKVTVVLSRTQGEKKISSMPYTLSLTGSHANLRMGTKIPIMVAAAASADRDGRANTQINPIQYQDVGTYIDCDMRSLDDGRFVLNLSIDDSSVYSDETTPASGAKGNPSFRSFRAANSMILRDGQTGQFTSATDKLTGETVKVDVTLTVVK